MFYLFHMLLANGTPPAEVAELYARVVLMQVQIRTRILMAHRRQRFMSMSPGEQYRRHLEAGGYRP